MSNIAFEIRRFSSVICFGAMALSAVVCAQSPHTPTQLLSFKSGDWRASTYLDGSYSALLRNNRFISSVYNRVYDLNPDGITLHQASYTLAYEPSEGLGGLLNPILGYDPLIFAPYGWDPNIGMKQIGFAMPQGYLQYKAGKLNIIGGMFNTLAGADFLDPNKDHNFSRSILWGNTEPVAHLGLRSTYVLDPHFKIIAGVNNGWDVIRDTSRYQTLEFSLVCEPTPMLSLSMVIYSGGQRAEDRTDDGPVGIRTLLDFVVTMQLTSDLSFTANYDNGAQTIAALPTHHDGHAVWQGFAGYLNYQLSESWFLSFRGELFDDTNGYRTGVIQDWKETTLTLGYDMLKNLQIRVEGRYDFSNVNAFLKASGQGTSNNQASFALEGLYNFM